MVDTGEALQLEEVLLLAAELTVATLLRACNTWLKVGFGLQPESTDNKNTDGVTLPTCGRGLVGIEVGQRHHVSREQRRICLISSTGRQSRYSTVHMEQLPQIQLYRQDTNIRKHVLD